jgi:transcriptional regulator with XRE-family HTH domain
MEAAAMMIGKRLRMFANIRPRRKGDIENRSGLIRCYISRVENNHTMPAVQILEKLARALEIPLDQLLHEREERKRGPVPATRIRNRKEEWGNSRGDAHFLNKLRIFLGRMDEYDREMLLSVAENLAKRKRKKPKTPKNAPVP